MTTPTKFEGLIISIDNEKKKQNRQVLRVFFLAVFEKKQTNRLLLFRQARIGTPRLLSPGPALDSLLKHVV